MLCPALHPGDVVVMDNLSAHKVSGVRELIQAAGAELLYLPPYSPDLNPIELAWAKLKQFLRSLQARTAEALEQAVTQALPCITPDNAQAWFRHCASYLYTLSENAVELAIGVLGLRDKSEVRTKVTGKDLLWLPHQVRDFCSC